MSACADRPSTRPGCAGRIARIGIYRIPRDGSSIPPGYCPRSPFFDLGKPRLFVRDDILALASDSDHFSRFQPSGHRISNFDFLP